MKERMKLIAEWDEGVYTKEELCARRGVSRKTGYKWAERFAREGVEGLKDRSRAPRSGSHRIASEMAERILDIRRRHRHWGPKKILKYLSELESELRVPAASTVGELLRREGLSEPGRRKTRWKHPGRPQSKPIGANQLWTADFKGHFRTRDGRYCYPLTVADEYSRYVLCCHALPSVCREGAWPVFERLFREVGLPEAIRTDNGAPFASTTGIHGLCALNVWWIKLGIRHERIEPGKPQQNACHERMHRTLKKEACRPPEANMREQQGRFDTFREEFNHERPHEALGQVPPARVWVPSERPYPRRIPEPCYPGHFFVRLVSNAGNFRFDHRQIFLSQALSQEYIGLEEIDDGIWSIYFYDLLLARLNQRTYTIHA